MGLVDEIKSKLKDYLEGSFETETVSQIPSLDDTKLKFGKYGQKFHASVLYIDMRGSTQALEEHNKTTVAKIHMAFFHVILKIANQLDGQVRSFDGDSALIFFEGNKMKTITRAVKTGLTLKYVFTHEEVGINKLFAKYRTIDFGIGIDHGEILCTKVGISGTNNRDLIWIGKAVNNAAKLGNDAKAPYNVTISSNVYSNLEDEVKYGPQEDFFGNVHNVDMWEESFFTFNGKYRYYHKTTWATTI